MKKLKRGASIYLDEEQQKESAVNRYLNCRDGVVEVLEYKDNSGYGLDTRLFLCNDTKHEIISIIKQSKISCTPFKDAKSDQKQFLLHRLD